MKLTVVEWLQSELDELEMFKNKRSLVLHLDLRDELFQQAKAMEKEQQRLIYEGLLQNVGTSIKQSDLPTFEQYYTEAYGK